MPSGSPCPQVPSTAWWGVKGNRLSLSTPGKLIPFWERELPEFNTVCLCVQTLTHPRRVQDCPAVHCQLHSCKSQGFVFFFFMKFITDDIFCETPVLKSLELHNNLFEKKQVLDFHCSREIFENQTTQRLGLKFKRSLYLKTCYFLMPRVGNVA